MNHWHPDLVVAERRIADLRKQADRERLADAARSGRSPLRLRVHLDFQLTFGRARLSSSQDAATVARLGAGHPGGLG